MASLARLEMKQESRRSVFGLDPIYLIFHPRTGQCSRCLRRVGDDIKLTFMHHALGYFPIFPWLGLVELCMSCRMKSQGMNEEVMTSRKCFACNKHQKRQKDLPTDLVLCEYCYRKYIPSVDKNGNSRICFACNRRHCEAGWRTNLPTDLVLCKYCYDKFIYKKPLVVVR